MRGGVQKSDNRTDTDNQINIFTYKNWKEKGAGAKRCISGNLKCSLLKTKAGLAVIILETRFAKLIKNSEKLPQRELVAAYLRICALTQTKTKTT